jgi:hypothetical protein
MRVSFVEKDRGIEVMRMGKDTKIDEKNTTMRHSTSVEHVAREIVIHAAILAAICTLIVMVIP